MGELSDKFHEQLAEGEEKPEKLNEAASLVLSAPVTAESSGLLALMYHEGIGVEINLDKCFELAEAAAVEYDPLGYFLIGYMCDNIETPDQEYGGPRQKYDHYDAERFYELCARTDSRWATPAHLWLGDYYMDSASGGDPDEAVAHYEAIGEFNSEAAGKLSDYYWEQLFVDEIIPDEYRTPDLEKKVYDWTLVASELNPHDYSYRMGCVLAEGIGCDAEGSFRLARKYWEDAYDFGDLRAADSIAMLYQHRLDSLPAEADEWERTRCQREIESWQRLAKRARERACGQENSSCDAE